MKKFISDPEAFVDNFVKAFHKDAKLYFYVTTTSTKNKFLMKLEINNHKYQIEASCFDVIYVSLDKVFKKAHPDLMLRPKRMVTIDDLVEKYGCDKNLVLNSIIDTIKKIFNYRYNIDHPIVFTAISYDYDIRKNDLGDIKLQPAKSFAEFAVNIDLGIH